MDLDALYSYRHKDTNQEFRAAVWREIALYLYDLLGQPDSVLDPACGRGEFINAVPALERWAWDFADVGGHLLQGVQFKRKDALQPDGTLSYVDGILASNLLEHLADPGTVNQLLINLRTALKAGGRIAIMGPNFRYAWREYWDCADHRIALTHIAVEEHLVAAGFKVTHSIPQFLPYSFRQRLPASPRLTRWYLRLPILWKIFGKQFLVVGEK